MDSKLVTDVLQEALEKYPAPLIFNSDQGSQYTGGEHTEILKEHKIQISMNGKGRSTDNIVIERFFRTLKYNCIFINDFQTIKKKRFLGPKHENRNRSKKIGLSILYFPNFHLSPLVIIF